MQTETDHVEVELELVARTDEDQHSLFFFNPDGIVIRDELTLEQWQSGLVYFREAHRQNKVYLAQYLSYGKLKYGKDAALSSCQQMELPFPLVKDALLIADIPASIRRPGLSNDHYIVLAKSGLSEKQQSKWAATADVQKLTPSTLRDSIKAGEVVSSPSAGQESKGLYSPHGIRGHFDIWLRRVEGLNGILNRGVDAIEEIINEFSAIAKLHDDLVSWQNREGAKDK